MNAKSPANKSSRPQTQPKRVHIEFSSGSACKVCVADTFNGWNPEKGRMNRVKHGTWAKDLILKGQLAESLESKLGSPTVLA